MAFFASAIGEKTSELASDHQLKVLVTAEQRIIKRRATQQSGSVLCSRDYARVPGRGEQKTIPRQEYLNVPFACFARIFAASSSFLRANSVPESELPAFYIRGKERLTNVVVLKGERGNFSPAWPVCRGSFDGRDLFDCRESFWLCLFQIYIYMI